MGSSQDATQSNLNLGKDDNVDLKETLSDLDELLKKELEGDFKETKEESVEVVTEAEIEIKVESETEDNSIVKIDVVKSVPTDMVEFDNTNDEKNDVDEWEKKSSIKKEENSRKESPSSVNVTYPTDNDEIIIIRWTDQTQISSTEVGIVTKPQQYYACISANLILHLIEKI